MEQSAEVRSWGSKPSEDSGRALYVCPALRRTLLLQRLRAQTVTNAPTLSTRALARVERTLNVRLPDDVLALFASTSTDLTSIVELTRDARDRCQLPPRYVAFATSSRNHVESYWCTLATTSSLARTQVCRWKQGRIRDFTMTEFVRRHYGLASPTDEERLVVDGLMTSFVPRLVGSPSILRRLFPRNAVQPGTTP